VRCKESLVSLVGLGWVVNGVYVTFLEWGAGKNGSRVLEDILGM
jgi:hypothetical protein